MAGLIYEVVVYLKDRKLPQYATFKNREEALKFVKYYRAKIGINVKSVSLTRYSEGKLRRKK